MRLVAISAAISSARLNSTTNSLGTLDELLVIAADASVDLYPGALKIAA